MFIHEGGSNVANHVSGAAGGGGGSCPKYRHEGGWLTETSISGNLAKSWGARGGVQGAERGKGQQGSWKTVQPAVSARCFLEENLLFLLLLLLRFRTPLLVRFTYGLVSRTTLLVDRFPRENLSSEFLPSSFFFFFLSFFFLELSPVNPFLLVRR